MLLISCKGDYMRRILLGIFGLIVLNTQAQVEIVKVGTTTDISGTTVVETITPDDVPMGMWDRTKFYVYNQSGEDQQYRVKRVKIDVPATGWMDELCWPPMCYSTTGEVYITPASVTSPAPAVLNGTNDTDLDMKAEIKPQYYPTQVGTSATYKYIVTDVTGDIHYDSITVKINFVASVGVNTIQKTAEIAVSPNPASDFVTVNAEGVEGKIKVVDVLGNVVYTGDLNNTKKINLSEFRSGVYFLTIQGDSGKGVTKKLVVRH